MATIPGLILRTSYLLVAVPTLWGCGSSTNENFDTAVGSGKTDAAAGTLIDVSLGVSYDGAVSIDRQPNFDLPSPSTDAFIPSDTIRPDSGDGAVRDVATQDLSTGASDSLAATERPDTSDTFADKGSDAVSSDAAVIPSSDGPSHVGAGGTALAVSSSGNQTCVLLAGGKVDCWGQLADGSTVFAPAEVPGLTDATAISVGDFASCAVLSNGTVRCWARSGLVTVTGLSGVTAISVGYDHGCAILSDTTVKCWYSPSASTAVTGLTGVTTIAAGDGFDCAVLSAGTVQCWGANGSGQLGNGSTTNSSAPTTVLGLVGATAISAASFNACAVLADSTVACWGDNSSGQLGNGDKTRHSTPVAVTGLVGASSITTSGGGSTSYPAYSCARLTDGTAKCWGDNTSGQLGNGSRAPSLTPLAVSQLGSIVSIATATTPSAAHTCAVLSGGSVECWGDNVNGQLANGSTTPVVVTGLAGATTIAGGYENTCAIVSGGGVKCWGQNTYGQLGDGTTVSAFIPVAVSNLTGATAISVNAAGATAYGAHTCALTGGTMQCWGNNYYGKLGNGNTTQSTVPVNVVGLTGITAIASGAVHTCAVVAGGVLCWGSSYGGALGNGTQGSESHVPVPVSTLTDIIAVSASYENTCALHSGGTVSCWGLNNNGELGDGTTTQSLTPVTVIGLANVKAIALGDPTLARGSSSLNGDNSFACALLSDGTVYCWGDNSLGQLGNGTTTSYSVPRPVLGVSGATAIATGGGFACALMTGGAVECWGNNSSGQLGIGGTNSSLLPVAVKGVTTAIAIAAGTAHTCVVLEDGTGRCWGYNGYGEIGTGTTIPIPVTDL